ncbi:MBL fold metallo-hydrolase [Oscillatoria sp. FACHB-1406]|nr:MBL fold metallo-hydrolase [Oscillatoria sp. FACHB-1406]MBD2578862.1 MBL fold metallo-hydrolase [Oscillatoria sp. FACHB-1406]
MKRRQLIRYGGASLLTAAGLLATSDWERAQAQSRGNLTVKALGHTCFLFSGGGMRILVNPFRTLGCTKGYRLPKVEADLVLVSSQLFDEGAAENLPGNPRTLFEAGAFEVRNTQFQGIELNHDREGGRRFGKNVAWRWTQAGVNILHLGGAVSQIGIEEQILIGRPDIAFIPVGGGPKAYTPEEALQALKAIRPKIAVPTHYRTQAADASACDIVSVDSFLELAAEFPVSRIGDTLALSPGNIPQDGTVIRVMGYRF